MNDLMENFQLPTSDDPNDVASRTGDGETQRRLVFIHLPKTGGTALRLRIASQFPHELICQELQDYLDKYDRKTLEKYLLFSGHFNFDSVLRLPGHLYIFTCLREPRDRILSLYYFWRRHTPEYIEEHDLAGPRLARSSGLLDFLRRGRETDVQNAMARQLAGAVVPTSRSGVYVAAPSVGSGETARELTGDDVIVRALENASRLDAVGIMGRLDELYDQVARETGLARFAEPLPRVAARDQSSEGLDDHVEEEPMTKEIQAELDRLTDLDRVVYQELCRRLPES